MRPIPLLTLISALVIAIWIITGVVLYPMKEDRGTIGDMFGVASSLFSGLALAGLVVNVVQQQRQIEQTSRDNLRAAEANDRAARLTALSALIVEYTTLVARKEEELMRYSSQRIVPGRSSDIVGKVHGELQQLYERRVRVFAELERTAGMSE